MPEHAKPISWMLAACAKKGKRMNPQFEEGLRTVSAFVQCEEGGWYDGMLRCRADRDTPVPEAVAEFPTVKSPPTKTPPRVEHRSRSLPFSEDGEKGLLVSANIDRRAITSLRRIPIPET